MERRLRRHVWIWSICDYFMIFCWYLMGFGVCDYRSSFRNATLPTCFAMLRWRKLLSNTGIVCFYLFLFCFLSLEFDFLCICFWICDNRFGLEWIRTIITVTFNSPHACPITDGSDFSSSTTSSDASSFSSSEDDSNPHSEYSFSDYDFSELKRDTFAIHVMLSLFMFIWWICMYFVMT